MKNLEFIKDKELRVTIENSIEYMYALYEDSRNEEKSSLYKEETYRVIVLYVISIIEAILLFFYKEKSDRIEKIQYKFITHLPNEYVHNKKTGLPVVIAVQEKIQKREDEIGLYELVNFFLSKRLIRKETAEEILELNDIRNTLHLSKPRKKQCDIDKVEESFKLLIRTIEKAPKALNKK